MLVPINMLDSKASSLAQSFGCIVGSLPFTYLGLPLGLSKLKVIDFLPLVSRCERRLTRTFALLSQAGRLEVTNSIFTGLPMFSMCTFGDSNQASRQIQKTLPLERIRYQCQKTT